MTTKAQVVTFRISDGLGKLIDQKRIALSEKQGTIPTRTDILRLALQLYLKVDVKAMEADGRRAASRSE